MSESNGERPRALVTGASSGIGRAFARRLAAGGHDLCVVARRKERLEELAEELQRAHQAKTEVLAADLSTPDGLELVCRRIEEGPALKVLVSNAGFGTRGLYHEVSRQKSAAMVALQAQAPASLIRAALPAMLEAKSGRILVVSSLGGFFTAPRYVAYSATKAFLQMFCEGLAAELAGTGVAVTVVCPGLTRTEFLDTPEYQDFKYGQVPAWAWMSAEQVVDEAMRTRAALLVPGLLNRLTVGVIRAPGLGWLVKKAMTAASRDRDGLY